MLKKTYDFDDFVSAVKKTNLGKATVKEMKYSDFYKWEDLSSKIKIKNMENRPYLSNITQVTAERGNFSLKYKTDNEQIFEMDFRQNKI